MSRANNIHHARVLITESRRRGRTQFAFKLLEWAGNARRRAMAVNVAPAQGDLFGGVA